MTQTGTRTLKEISDRNIRQAYVRSVRNMKFYADAFWRDTQDMQPDNDMLEGLEVVIDNLKSDYQDIMVWVKARDEYKPPSEKEEVATE